MAESNSIRPQAQALIALRDEMRSIGMAAGQCSVEGDEGLASSMAAAEAERCLRWADALEAILVPSQPSDSRGTSRATIPDETQFFVGRTPESLHGSGTGAMASPPTPEKEPDGSLSDLPRQMKSLDTMIASAARNIGTEAESAGVPSPQEPPDSPDPPPLEEACRQFLAAWDEMYPAPTAESWLKNRGVQEQRVFEAMQPLRAALAASRLRAPQGE